MSEKLKSAIEKIVLNATVVAGEEYAATFHGAEIEPTFVNFLFGSNGTGKSSIAAAIDFLHGENGKGRPAVVTSPDRPFELVWKQSQTELDYDLYTYNQRFVEDNFSNYGNVLGIFTMGDKNVEIQKEVAEIQKREGELRQKITASGVSRGEMVTERNGLLASYQESFCKAGNTVRRAFSDALKGKVGKNADFAKFVFELALAPVEHDMDALTTLYGVAYDAKAQKYGEFRKIDLSQLKAKTQCDLLAKAIVSTSSTPFAETIRRLGNGGLEWVVRGHEHFESNVDGKCPYCQGRFDGRKFAEQLQTCFDKDYQDAIAAVKSFRIEYERYVRAVIEGLNANLLQDVFPKLELTIYKDKIAAIETILKLNIQLIDGKIKEPSLPMSDALADIETLCVELNALIEGFNRQIKENNGIFADKENQRKECERRVKERLAFDVKEIKEQYHIAHKALSDKISALETQINADTQVASGLSRKKADLSKGLVDIEKSVNSINRILCASGFEGFELRMHDGSGQSAYQVIRTRTGKPVKNLSEGERNFIAFLYFYHLVNKGSHSDADTGKDRIVVIDDPVSSMDSSVLFIVSGLVREMIEICYNNVSLAPEAQKGENYIKQLFVLTHNMYFHSAITHEQVSRYDGVSFFLVNKTNETSTVTLCDEWQGAGSKTNVNPVKSAYVALWSEYKDLLKAREDASTSYRATLLNNSNQILEHYFIQLCGYSRDAVRNAVKKASDGFTSNENNAKYMLALSMLDSITSDSRYAPDSAYFSGGTVDAAQYQEAFKSIFTAMSHQQHYEKMMI
jgi:wobble nucleotide-excising tRNase